MTHKNLILFISTILISLVLSAQAGITSLKLVRPVGEIKNGYQLMEIYDDNSPVYDSVFNIIRNSAIQEFLGIHSICQQYLVNIGAREKVEPAYLALTQNVGGYAKKGFYLLDESGDTLDHRQTHYVDIKLERFLTDYAGLMSFTQLYPHELAHVIYGQVSLNDSVDPDNKNVDMHYFPVITDYSTAFNEGFAIHFENISRLIEKNPKIVTAIHDDLERIVDRTESRIPGFLNDIHYPVRLGYYKSSVILWFQQFEDYRRHVHALDGSIKYLNYSPGYGSIEDQITIRNMGLLYSSKPRNIVQSCATEGVVASFFTQLFLSELKNVYYDADLYRPFLSDTSDLSLEPEKKFSPIENLFIKYFLVLNTYVSKFNTSGVQLLDFVHGYKEMFPTEAQQMDSVFYKATGHELPYHIPSQIWMMVKDHEHRMLAIDPFGAATIRGYTFDLNAADYVDLKTIPGLSDKDAEELISYRDERGLFHNLDEINGISTISDNAKSSLMSSSFDREYFNSIPEPELNFSAIKNAPVKHIVKMVLIYLICFLALMNIFLIRGTRIIIRVWLNIKYTFLWLFLAATAAVLMVIVNYPLYWMAPLIILIYAVTVLIYRRKPQLNRNLIMLTLMSIVIVFSLI